MEPMMIALMHTGRNANPTTLEREVADALANAEVAQPARKRAASRTMLKRFGF